MNLHALEFEVFRVIREGRLLLPGQRVLLGVSAGRDSICLLAILQHLQQELGFRLLAAHFNHGLRGGESGQDARFIRQVCRKLGVDCISEKWRRTPQTRQRDKTGEHEAREARFEFLLRTLDVQRCDALALAHHADDAAETVLLNLLRGSGMKGLSGIELSSRFRGKAVVRPLLGVSRAAIDEYLDAQKLRWREDSSNADRSYLRNRVRHELLPLLERKYNPGIRGALGRLAEILSAEDRLLDDLAAREFAPIAASANGGGAHELPLAALREQPDALLRRILRHWLIALRPDEYPPPFRIVEDLLNFVRAGKSGGLLHSAGSLVFEHTGKNVRLISRTKGVRVRKKK